VTLFPELGAEAHPPASADAALAYPMRVWQVADLPPMPDPDRVAQLALRVGERYREVDWLAAARVSVAAAARERFWALPEWRTFGRRHLPREEDHVGFDALLSPPICIADDGWFGGMLLAALMIRAGAPAFAAEDPAMERRQRRRSMRPGRR
jgi:hypothetical protein